MTPVRQADALFPVPLRRVSPTPEPSPTDVPEPYRRDIDGLAVMLGQEPDSARLFHARGRVYMTWAQAGDRLELRPALQAVDDFDTALRLDPDYTTAYLNRGLLYAALWRAVPTASYRHTARRDLREYMWRAGEAVDPAATGALARLDAADE